MNFVISKELVEKILSVLTEMPYRSVFQLVSEIQAGIKPLETKEDSEENSDA